MTREEIKALHEKLKALPEPEIKFGVDAMGRPCLIIRSDKVAEFFGVDKSKYVGLSECPEGGQEGRIVRK